MNHECTGPLCDADLPDLGAMQVSAPDLPTSTSSPASSAGALRAASHSWDLRNQPGRWPCSSQPLVTNDPSPTCTSLIGHLWLSMAHDDVSQGPGASHFCGRGRPGAILATSSCRATPSASSPQPQPEGDFETADGTGSLEAVQTALKEADDDCSNESSSRKGSSGLKGIVVRLAAVCSITALIWAFFASGNAALRIAAGVVGTACGHLLSCLISSLVQDLFGGGGGGVYNMVFILCLDFPFTLIATFGSW